MVIETLNDDDANNINNNMKAFNSIGNWCCILRINNILYSVILSGRTIAFDYMFDLSVSELFDTAVFE